MQLAKLQCKLGAQFHFGKLGLDENMSLDDTSDYIHSDTLFSALINEHFFIFGDENKTDAFVKAFENNKIKISSGFYSLAFAKRQILFFPVPVHFTFLVTKPEILNNIKQLKKIKFASQCILNEGISPEEWFTGKCVIIQDKFVCKKEEIEDLASLEQLKKLKIFTHHSETKVKVHTTSQEGVLYNQVNIQIAENEIENLKINFFFLFDVLEEFKNQLEKVIHSLEFSGIGGQRSTGSGQFEKVEISNYEYNVPIENVPMSISLIIPENENLDNFEYYDFIERGGRRIGFNPEEGTGFNLKRVKMIQEGAMLKNNSEKGKITDLKPKGEAGIFLRNGKAFLLPIHKNFEYDK